MGCKGLMDGLLWSEVATQGQQMAFQQPMWEALGAEDRTRETKQNSQRISGRLSSLEDAKFHLSGYPKSDVEPSGPKERHPRSLGACFLRDRGSWTTQVLGGRSGQAELGAAEGRIRVPPGVCVILRAPGGGGEMCHHENGCKFLNGTWQLKAPGIHLCGDCPGTTFPCEGTLRPGAPEGLAPSPALWARAPSLLARCSAVPPEARTAAAALLLLAQEARHGRGQKQHLLSHAGGGALSTSHEYPKLATGITGGHTAVSVVFRGHLTSSERRALGGGGDARV